MPKHCNLAKHRVFTKDRNAYICITQQFSVMLIDNKYTTKHPCITANYNMYQPHTGKREHRERHQPVFSNSHLTDIDFPIKRRHSGR